MVSGGKDTATERQRRHRAHKRGDHRLCHPDRCEELRGPQAVPEPAPVRPVRVTSVTRDAGIGHGPDDLGGDPLEVADWASMAAAVEDALADAPVLARDAAAVALARRYAALLDEPAPLAKYEEPLRVLRAVVAAAPDPGSAERHLVRIENALAAHSVASDLGPKLLAALTALGMTAAGRAPKVGGTSVPAVVGKLDELRARKARRAGAD